MHAVPWILHEDSGNEPRDVGGHLTEVLVIEIILPRHDVAERRLLVLPQKG